MSTVGPLSKTLGKVPNGNDCCWWCIQLELIRKFFFLPFMLLPTKENTTTTVRKYYPNTC
jgi:hypothetical protein